MIQIRELDHVVLRVSDVEMMVDFYCRVFCCTVEKRQQAFGLVQLRAGNSLVDFVDVAGPLGRAGGAPPGVGGRNLDHFCFRVEPFDVPAVLGHLDACGIAAGDIGSRYGAEGQGPSVYVTDPEGNVVELKGPPDLAVSA